MEEEDEGDEGPLGGGSRESLRRKSDGDSSSDSGSFESLSSPRQYEDASDRAMVTSNDGKPSFSNGNTLRERVMDLVEKCERLERQKQAAVDLLADKKRQLEDMKSRYDGKLKMAELDVDRLTAENQRLLERLNLSPNEIESFVSGEKEMSEMKKRMTDLEMKYSETMDDNMELRHDLREARLEMEELHDQFREDEALEFRELQKELESTAKNCRILQFKLRKIEKRCEQLELDKRLNEERHRHQTSEANRMESVGDEESQMSLLRRRISEFEEELRVAKEVSVKLHDQMEIADERRTSYEHELERVSALLNESEVEKLTLRTELEYLREQQGGKGPSSLSLPQIGGEKPHSPTILPRTPSPSVDLQLIMRDLNDSLEREHDLREQLKFSEEEIVVMRKKMAEMEEELESANHQLAKLATAKQATSVPRFGSSVEAAEREQELKLQIELSESEAKVLRRRLDDIDSSYEVLLTEVKQMRSRVTSFGLLESSTDKVSSSGLSLTRSTTSRDSNYEESVMNLARDIDKLKVKLIERNQYAERDVRKQSLPSGSSSCQMIKSKSLEDDNIDLGSSIHVSGRIGRLKKMARVREEEEEARVYLDARIQAEILEQEALLLRSKVKILEQDVVCLRIENDNLRGKSTHVASSHQAGDAQLNSIEILQRENASLRATLGDLEEKMSKFNKEFLRMKFRTVDLSKDKPDDWKEIKQQVLVFEDENRKSQRKIVDLEAEILRLKMNLEKWEPTSTSEISSRKEELDRNSKDFLKERIIELEGELKSLRKVTTQKDEEIEQLENEISEGREDLGKLMDAFKRREDLLSEELDDLKKRNSAASDLLKLVTERAESTQKELEELKERKETGLSPPGSIPKKAEQSDIDALRKQIQILQKMLTDEKRKSEATLRMKVADDRTSQAKQHEKDITQQELSLCQKQLKAANDQICNLKEKLTTLKEIHENLKEDLAKVTKELEKTKEQKEVKEKSESPTNIATTSTCSTISSLPTIAAPSSTTTPPTSEPTTPVALPRSKEPASWRWEKQELERQLKELRKKLDDSYTEMKRYQVRWKAAGEDIERESQFKLELGKKIEKLTEENKNLSSKLDEQCESLKKSEKHWEKELNMAVKEREDAEKEVKHLSEMIASKDDIIQQKNKLITDKEKSSVEKDKALRESTEATIVAEVSLRNTQSELISSKEQLASQKVELTSLKQQFLEKAQESKQLDEQLRRRDDRLKEKDDFLQQINRKLTEKGNQVSDMDKTIRQIIRKLQARDCDLGMTNAELRRVQNELRLSQEKYQEAKASLDAWETKAKLDVNSVSTKSDKEFNDLEEKVKQLSEEKKAIETNLCDLKDIFKTFKEEEDGKISELKEKLKLAEERVHASELLLTAADQKCQSQSDSNANFTPSDAYKQMMREKELLISEKFKLSDELNKAKRQLESLKHELEKAQIDFKQVHLTSAASNFSAVVGMTGSPSSVKKQRPESLSLSLTQTSTTDTAPKTAFLSTSNNINSLAEASQVIAGLRAKLSQQELHWRAEKATLEEYYDTQAHQMREISKQLQTSNQLLRKECDSQLLVLQNSRRALSDLRHRFDLATIAWNEERDTLKCKVDRVEELKEQIKTLDKANAELSLKLSTVEAKKSEFENKLSIDTATWKIEKEGMEEKIKALQASLASQNTESSTSTNTAATTTKSTPFTRVSEFKARFEKFSRMGKKFEDSSDKTAKRNSDGGIGASGNSVRLLEDLVKGLQGQINQLESRRMADENAWRKRLNDLNNNYESDLSELRKKLSTFEKKDKEYLRQQRILSELQFRFVDDACQWQQQRAQLEQQMETSRNELVQHKESVGRLLAEVKRIQVLTSNFGLASQSNVDAKTRSRSLTPSAEKLRILALNSKEKDPNILNEGESQLKAPFNDLVIQDIVQAVDAASRLAEEINKPGVSSPHFATFNSSTSNFGGRKNLGMTGSFKRSSSSAEVTSTKTSEIMSGVMFRPSKKELKKSSSQEGDTNSEINTAVTIPVNDSKSNRNSMYTSGTQSAYASRDHSPDTKFLPSLTLPRSQASRSLRNSSTTIVSTSSYPKVPPSMIITPSQTPRREESAERVGGNVSDVDVSVVYRKLEAILATEDSDKSFNRRVAVVSGADDHYLRSAGDRQMFGISETSSGDISFVPPADSMSAVTKPSPSSMSDRFSFASRTLPVLKMKQLASSVSVTTPENVISTVTVTGRGSRSDSKFGGKQRSASVSPRTARRQFYENYDKLTKPQQSQQMKQIQPQIQHKEHHQIHTQQVHPQYSQQKKYMFSDYTAEHREPGDILGIEPGFTPISRSAVTTSAGDINSTARSQASLSCISQPTSSSSAGKKFLKMFSSKEFSSTDQEPSACGKSGFFQSVRERRKLFGKKASSVDSPIGVSIARIGVNILTEPAAPSNYQPPDLPDVTLPHSMPTSTTPTFTSSGSIKGDKRK